MPEMTPILTLQSDYRSPAGRSAWFSRVCRLAFAGVLVCLVLAGCAGSGARDGVGGKKGSTSQQVTMELERSVGFVDDAELQAYVETVGRRITAQSKRKDVNFRFHILDMPIPNALALPEGQVFISRGVLILVNSEDELAGILAHEIAHLEERHAAERENLHIVTSPIRLGAGIAGWATGLIIPDLGDAIVELGETTTGLVLAPYSREQEREADRVGQNLVAAAGYDPQGLVNLLDTMDHAEALDPANAHEQSFFDTHPTNAERVELTMKHGQTLRAAPRPASARDRKGVLETLQGLVVGDNPGKGFFDGNWFVHPKLAFAMGFPPEWKGINADGFVGSQAPNEESFVMLALVGKGADPLTGAKAASQKLDIDLVTNARLGTVNGLSAAKNQGQVSNANGDVQKFELTWIAYGGLIYQIMAVAPAERYDALEELMRQSAHSFRALNDAEVEQILVTQLAIVEARRGESIAALAERVQTKWSADAIAVVNRKSAGAVLEAGELLKVGIQKGYKPSTPHASQTSANQSTVTRSGP